MSDETQSAVQYEDEVSLLDLLVPLAENARLLIFGPLVAGIVALGITFLMPPVYTGETRILPPQQQQSAAAMIASQLGAFSGLAGAAGLNIKSPTDLYVGLVKSRTIADRMIDRFDLMKLYDVEFKEWARMELEDRTNVVAEKDGVISIKADDHDPKRAADMANAYVEELTRLNASLALTETQQRRAFFEKQLRDAQENLARAQLALGEVGLPENLIKSSPEAVVESIARLKAQIAAQEIRVSSMRSYLTEQSPEFRRARSELSSMREQLAQIERGETVKDPQRSAYLNRYRDYKYHETLFELMAKQYEAARLDEAREGAVIQVVDVAVPPELKSKPRRGVIAVLTAFLIGLLLAIVVLVREMLRNASTDPQSAGKLHRIQAGIRRVFIRKA